MTDTPPSFEPVRCERPEPGIARVVMNRPKARNAQNLRMTYDLDAALRPCSPRRRSEGCDPSRGQPAFSPGTICARRTSRGLPRPSGTPPLGRLRRARRAWAFRARAGNLSAGHAAVAFRGRLCDHDGAAQRPHHPRLREHQPARDRGHSVQVPGVQEVAVVAMPHPRLGYGVCAFVVLSTMR